MTPTQNQPKKGSLLVAEPFLGDENFERSVVLLTEHNEDGSIGFVLNKPLEVKIDDIAIDFPTTNSIAHHGGPVQEDNLYFIHNKGNLLPGSDLIYNDWYWGGDLEPLKELLGLGLIAKENIRFYLGYSGWSAGQLDFEISEKSWVVLEPGTVDVFNCTTKDLWKTALHTIGGSYPLWANSPVDPTLN